MGRSHGDNTPPLSYNSWQSKTKTPQNVHCTYTEYLHVFLIAFSLGCLSVLLL